MFADKVMESCSITGTGGYSLGGAVGAYRTWRSQFATASQVFYFSTNAGGTKWEAGYGTLTYGTPDVLSRTLLASSTGALVSWSASDAPFYVYSAPNSAALQFLIAGGLASARPAWMQSGLWLHQDNPAAGKRALKLFDGTQDVRIGVLNPTAHTLSMDCAPAGVVFDYAGTAAPAGFLLCYGQAISRTTYADLFAAISTTYGTGDGSTTFNIPDLRGRVIAGKSNMGGSDAGNLTGGGTLGGSLGGQSNTAATTVSGSASGTVSGGVSVTTATGGTAVYASGGGGMATGYDHNHAASFSVGASLSVSANGTSGAFSVVQPSLVLNKIISTGGV